MSKDDGGRVVPDQFPNLLYQQLTTPNPYRRWSEIRRRPLTRRQRWMGHIWLAIWTARYRLSRAIYPWTERDE